MNYQPWVIHGSARSVDHNSVVEALREHALNRPDSIAIEHRLGRWSFARLWSEAVSIADAIVESGVEPGARVAVWGERTAGIIAAALGIMAVGAAYVPLDPAAAENRSTAILEAAELDLVVFDGAAQSRPPAVEGIRALDISDVSTGPRGRIRALPRSSDAAYVIFTSGSTGLPKGVVVEHASLINYASWCASIVGAGGGVPLFGNLGFDHSITSLWPPLVGGNAVKLCEGVWDQDALFGIRDSPFELIKVTPSHLRFFERTVKPDYRASTRILMSGGEMLDTALLREIGGRLDGVRLINHYGPTETTVGCCFFEFDSASLPDSPSAPIGRPIWNTRAYVVNDGLTPVAVGGSGQLVIAGAGVARGYLGQTASSSRFVDEAELGGAAGRAYLTGDQVELLPDGNLLYLGRLDDQVKLNGYRIELGALRSHLVALDEIEDAGIEVERGAVDRIRVFVVPRHAAVEETVNAVVRSALSTLLPPSLLPRRVSLVSEIALTNNGKRDLAETKLRWASHGGGFE